MAAIEHRKETEIEKEKIREILANTFNTQNMFDKLLSKSLLPKTLRILSWINHFLSYSRKHKMKDKLTTNELLKQKKVHFLKSSTTVQ